MKTELGRLLKEKTGRQLLLIFCLVRGTFYHTNVRQNLPYGRRRGGIEYLLPMSPGDDQLHFPQFGQMLRHRRL
jgi:hypothetical protein